MAIKRGNHFDIARSATDVIKKGDVLVVIGNNQNLKKLEEKAFKEKEKGAEE
jgi:trk system potassium uptake protein TrkA